MALYHEATISWIASLTSAKAQLLDSRSITKTESVDFTEHQSSHFNLADGASDEAFSLGKVAEGKALLIVSDRKISVKVDGQSLTIGHTDDEGGVLMLTAGSFTALLFSNSSGAAAAVHVSVPGA